MNRLAIAALVWLGVDIFLGVVGAPAIVLVLIPGLVRAWGRRDIAYMIDALIPNVMMIVPGGIAAGTYYVIARRVSSR